jgi:hypothetical protein
MGGQAFTPADTERLRELVIEKHPSGYGVPHHAWTSIGTALGRTPSACRVKWGEVRAALQLPRPVHVDATTTEGPPSSDPVDVLWRRAEELTAKAVARATRERHVHLDIDDDRPVALVAVSDQHIATQGPVQLAAMRQDAELIASEPGMFAILGGDGVDNHIKHRSAMLGGDRVADSWRLYDHYLSLLGSKVLAMVSGNHDDWTRDFAGIDMVQQLAQRNALHYCPDEALLSITLGTQRYRYLMRHQYRFNSSMNLTHSAKRLWEYAGDEADIVCVCHHHEGAAETVIRHGLPRVMLRPGSYQLQSGYSRRIGFAQTQPTCPTVIVFPDTRDMLALPDVWHAATVLRALRKAWPHVLRRPAAA